MSDAPWRGLLRAGPINLTAGPGNVNARTQDLPPVARTCAATRGGQCGKIAVDDPPIRRPGARRPDQNPVPEARARTVRAPTTFTAFGLASEAEPLAPGLHIVATPIGNLRDITIRALATLAAADAVLAEDTRVTRTLLAHYGITTPLLAYHEHSNDAVRERMVARLRAGEALALVSDAGTPLVSDPGYKLVQAAIEAGIAITPVPGPSAVMTALVAAGLPTDRFFFEGFLPQKAGARRNRLEALVQVPGNVGPVRVAAPPAGDAGRRRRGARPGPPGRGDPRTDQALRDRPARYAGLAERALRRGRAAEGRDRRDHRRRHDARSGPSRATPPSTALIRTALERHSIKDAASLVADETGQPRRAVYTRALALARGRRLSGLLARAHGAAPGRVSAGPSRRVARAAALMLKGYWPIGRRVSLAGGEIDLIVQRWTTVVFVEVKARARRDEAREAIDAAKRRRFSRAVRSWIGRNAWCAGMTFRADAVFVGARDWPAHVADAFTIEGL